MRTNEAVRYTDELSQILMQVSDVPNLIRQIYELRKRESSKVSLEYLRKRSGIPTKSNLSEIMRGRRKLSRKHGANLAKALGLEGVYATLFIRMCEHDRERSPEQRGVIAHEIKLLKKVIAIEVMENSMSLPPFAFLVFCALGLFGNKATEDELRNYFKSQSADAVKAALMSLVDQKLVILEERHYSTKVDQIKFTGKTNYSPQLAFLKHSLDEAAEMADRHWKSGLALFDSTIISVRKVDFEEHLRQFREILIRQHSTFEASSADSLVRVNVQIYPID